MALERHQAFFSRLVNYKLLLEDKWKVFETLIRSSPAPMDPQNDPDQLATRKRMDELAARMEQVTQDSQTWEERLKEGVQRWRDYQEALRLTTHWLHRAEALLTEKNANAQQTLEAHDAFFSTTDDQMIANLQSASAQLQQWLPDERRRMTVADAVDNAVTSWQRLVSQAPQHKMKLEFRLDEEAFLVIARDLERQLALEQQALSLPTTNTEQLLQQHIQWFVKPSPAVSQARLLVERLEKAAASIPEVRQAYQNVSDQWQLLNKRSETLLNQLEAIPQKWTEYLTKFDEMVAWMDSVDQSVSGMSEDAGTLENYDRLRAQFHAVCSDVDARRAGMKWLVQRLDSLLSYKSEEEGAAAQLQLEGLIGRYKNLVMIIESNASKAELLSKCYTCREEIHKVCSTLEGIQEQVAKTDPCSDEGDLEALDADTRKHEALVKQLDGQRAAIVSLLQRGRDLQHHANAPGFLTREVQQLEIIWNKTNELANEKLKKLKGSGRLWRDYLDQKNEITQLLSKAEEELRQTYSTVDPLKIASELRARHDAGVALREATEDILHRMRTILEELSVTVGADQRRSMEEELRSIERQTESIRNINMEKIAMLEEFNARLKVLLAQVDSIMAWLQTAQKLLQQLLSLNLSPEERVKRTNELQLAITAKLNQLGTIQDEATNLLSIQGSPATSQAQLLGVDMDDLRSTIVQMGQTVQEQSQSVIQDMAHWQEYSLQAGEIKPWLDEAEKRTAIMTTRPGSISEMESLLEAARLFEDECKKQLVKLQAMSSHCQQMFHQSSARDEVDALHSRWNGVRDTVVQQLQRLENLQTSWTSVIKKMDSIVEWLDAVEAQLDSLQQLSSTIGSLENQLGDLKVRIDHIRLHLILNLITSLTS